MELVKYLVAGWGIGVMATVAAGYIVEWAIYITLAMERSQR